MAKIDSIFKKESKPAGNHPKRVTKWIHYTKLKDNKDQYCNERDKEEILALADLIEADGEVLQNLLVRKIDTDEYEIIAGHKRRRACRTLVEERGKTAFALLPCLVQEISDVRAEFQLYSSNGYHEKSDYERMYELERMKALLEQYPEEFPQVQKGRMVERLARLLNMKKSTVGEYLTISKNLGESAMEKFKEGELKKSAAVQMAALPEEEQEELIQKGKLSLNDVKAHKEQKTTALETVGSEPDESEEKPQQKEQTEAKTTEAARERTQGETGQGASPREEECHRPEERFAEVAEGFDPDLLQEQLDEAEKLLKDMQDAGYAGHESLVRKQKLLVAALAEFQHNLNQKRSAVKEAKQPELPVMKNDEQRKGWLRNYKTWGLWYEDPNIGCRYYKYDFENGARLIVEAYQVMEDYETSHFHLVGGPKPITGRYGIGKWSRHERYSKHSDSETELVEFLKFVQKDNK